MWFEWLVRRCDMGALAVVSTLQPPSSVDPQGSEHTISQSAHDVASLWSRQKAERRVLAPHIFPPASPLLGPSNIANELVSSLMWSPYFDNSPCKDLGYHAGPNGLKTLSPSFLGDANNEGKPWVSEPLNQLAKNYLQTVQELKQSSFSHCQDEPLQPERYKELKVKFWKQLASDSLNDKRCNFACISGAQASDVRVEGGVKAPKSTKTATLSRLQGSSTKRGGSGLNGSVEIEVLLTGKWNALPIEEATMNPKEELATNQTQEDAALCVQNVACVKEFQHCQELNLPLQGGIDQSFAKEKDHDDDICRIGASSREASDKESLVDYNVARCEYNPLQHHQHHEQRQQDGSECSFGSGGGIGRGRIGEDGSPTSTSSNHQTREESKASVGNMDFSRKEVDKPFWSSANWCVVDSYMTGHGKETTWTVCGFEEDDGVFEGNLPNCKDRSPLKIFANEKKLSPLNDLAVTQFLPIEAIDVDTQHGPPPKWTQQALQEQVAKNLLAQQKDMRSSKNGLEIVKSLVHKQTKEGMDTEDGSRDKVKRGELVVGDLMPIGNMLYCRKGRKSMNEAVLKETRDKVEGGDLEASPDVNDIESASWKSVRRSSNACVGPSTFKSNQDKELLNMVTRREIQRRKRGWAKRKVQPPTTGVACCVSVIGDTVKALRRTREDALKLAEFQETELKAYKAAAFAMRIHVDLLQSEVQELEREREFNVLVVFPWQQFLRNIVIGISLVSGTLSLHRALKSLFQLLFGQVVQISTSKKEKTMVAMIILCSGSYVGKEMWQLFSQVHATKTRNETIFQEKLCLVHKRLSHMSTLIYKNGIMHQGQAKDTNKTI